MKKIILLLISFFCLTPLIGQYNRILPPTSVATTDNALAVNTNPSALGYRSETELYALFPYQNRKKTDWFSGSLLAGSMAFNGIYYRGYQQWQVGSGTSLWNSITIGSTLRWFGTKNYKPEYDVGMMARPKKFISIGTSIKNIFSRNSRSELLNSAVAIRLFGEILTLSAGIYRDIAREDNFKPKYYGKITPIQGLELSASYINNENIKLGLNINFSNLGISLSSINDDQSKYEDGVVGIHLSANNYSAAFQKDKKKIAKIELEGEIKEQNKLFSSQPFSSVRGIVSSIKTLQESKEVDGLLLKFENSISAGFSKRLEIRKALERFKQSGKKIYCYANSLSNGQYFIASVADKIFLNPSGTAWVSGLSSTSLYFKEALNKLGIEPEFEYIGKYKSAHEPFTNKNRSEPDQKQQSKLLNDLYSVYLNKVSLSRGINVDSIKQIIKKGPLEAPLAYKNGLVDSLIYRDEVKGSISSEAKSVKLSSGKNIVRTPPYKTVWQYDQKSSQKIALIYASGGITEGKSHRSFSQVKNIGSETLCKAIQQARADNSIKGIVLRVDSPGGSALASDIILREVQKTVRGKTKKPFIVSMSDVAASGGYYISCLADKIVASPTTITGSIGVLGGKVNLEGLMSKIGVNSSTIKTTPRADMMSPFREWTNAEEQKLQEHIKWIYDEFTQNVSQGRNIPQEEVNKLGRGRIWSGLAAKRRGLVDTLGGLKTALEIAAHQAGIQKELNNINLAILPAWSDYSLDLGFPLFAQKQSSFQKLWPDKNDQARAYFNTWLMNRDEKVHLMMPYWLMIE